MTTARNAKLRVERHPQDEHTVITKRGTKMKTGVWTVFDADSYDIIKTDFETRAKARASIKETPICACCGKPIGDERYVVTVEVTPDIIDLAKRRGLTVSEMAMQDIEKSVPIAYDIETTDKEVVYHVSRITADEIPV